MSFHIDKHSFVPVANQIQEQIKLSMVMKCSEQATFCRRSAKSNSRQASIVVKYTEHIWPGVSPVYFHPAPGKRIAVALT